MEIKLKYVPFDKQRELHRQRHEARIRIAICGRRAGKSYSAIADTLMMALERGTPENCGIIMEPTYDMCKNIAVRTIHEIWPKEFIVEDYNKTEHKMKILTPRGEHELFFLSATRPDKSRGIPKIGYALADEVALYEEDAIRNLVIGLADEEAPLLMTTTPKFEVGTLWLKEQFDEGMEHNTRTDIDWYDRKFAINWSMFDNPTLSDRAKRNLDNEFDGDWAQQELYGLFVKGGMLIFSDLEFKTYETEKTEWRNLEYYMTIDPAYTSEDLGSNSQSSITVDGLDKDRNFKFIENPHGFWGTDELVDKIFITQHKYGIRRMGIESVAAQVFLLKLIEERMRRENKAFEIVELPITGNKDKVGRAQVMVPFIKTGRFQLPTTGGHLTHDAAIAQKQFKSFPLGRLSDIVDSNAHMFHNNMQLVEGFDYYEPKEEKETTQYSVLSKEQVAAVMSGGKDDRDMRLN